MLKILWMQDVVVIQRQNELACAHGQTRVAGRRGDGVGLADIFQPGVIAKSLRSPVRRAIINHNDFSRADGLGENALQRFTENRALIVCWEDHRYTGWWTTNHGASGFLGFKRDARLSAGRKVSMA